MPYINCIICKKRIWRKPSYIHKTKNICCSYECSYINKSLIYSGRNNPNCKYKDLSDNYFTKIDTIEKAYILGWIASDGTIGNNIIRLNIHKKDIDILYKIRDCIDVNLKIKKYKNMIYLNINSKQWCVDILRHLDIKDKSKKSYSFRIPKLSKKFISHFLRGYYDGDGSIRQPRKVGSKALECSIASINLKIKKTINQLTNNLGRVDKYNISWSSNNAETFLKYIYQNHNNLVLKRKLDIFNTIMRSRGIYGV